MRAAGEWATGMTWNRSSLNPPPEIALGGIAQESGPLQQIQPLKRFPGDYVAAAHQGATRNPKRSPPAQLTLSAEMYRDQQENREKQAMDDPAPHVHGAAQHVHRGPHGASTEDRVDAETNVLPVCVCSCQPGSQP